MHKLKLYACNNNFNGSNITSVVHKKLFLLKLFQYKYKFYVTWVICIYVHNSSYMHMTLLMSQDFVT